MKYLSPRVRIGLTALALLALLLFQLRWIMQARSLKEEMFLEKKAMVLARVTEDIWKDPAVNSRLNHSFDLRDRQLIDSLVRQYLKYYGLKAAYAFTVVYPSAAGKVSVLGNMLPAGDTVACYSESLEEQAGLHRWMLHLDIEYSEEQLWSSLMGPVILSAVLVGIVLFLFYKSVKSWQEEKFLLEQTRDFMNNMAHEFRTPITNIALASKMLQREGAGHEKYLQMIRDENNRLSGQVDMVLSMYAMESSRQQVKRERLDLRVLLEDAVYRFSLQAIQKNGHLLMIGGDVPSFMNGDPQLLSIVIGNLIDNALKYSGLSPEVKLEIIQSDQWLEVHITDTGPGIPGVYHEKIFERYFRISNQDVHDVKGFGLGLAFVKQVVELHGGSIHVKSGSGKGTTFILRFPHA